MEQKAGEKQSVHTSALYCIYSDGMEDNMYETIKTGPYQATLYDEVFQPKSSLLGLMSPTQSTCEVRDQVKYCAQMTSHTCQRKCCGCQGIPLWVIIVIIFIFTTIAAGYFDSEMKSYIEGSIVTYSTTTVKSMDYTTTNPFDESCISIGPADYMSKPWFIVTPDFVYQCDIFEKIKLIMFQSIKVENEVCTDKTSCLEMIKVYKNIMYSHAKYSFYLDGEGNVYSGRNWTCQFISGTIWVGIVADIDTPFPLVNPIFRHLLNEISSYAIKCRYFATDVDKNFENTTYVQMPSSTVTGL